MGDWSISITLSICEMPRTFLCCARLLAGLVQVAFQRPQEDVVDQRALAGAGDAGDADEAAERELDVDVLEVVLGGPFDLEALLEVVLAPLGGDQDALLAAEVLAGERLLALDDLVEGALGNEFAAVRAGRRADVDDVVGGAHDVLVVLDDDHGVADLAELLEDAEEPVVVALVQADGRLIEHVADARPGRCRPAWPGGCAGPRRRPGCCSCGRA